MASQFPAQACACDSASILRIHELSVSFLNPEGSLVVL